MFPSEPSHPPSLTQRPILIDVHNLVHPGRPINPLIYGGFIEHLGRCIYGGITDDPKRPSPSSLLTDGRDGLGWRKDVIKMLRDELEVPLMRWPGGNFASNYHWQDGIGPIDKRPRRIELAWGASDSNKQVDSRGASLTSLQIRHGRVHRLLPGDQSRAVSLSKLWNRKFGGGTRLGRILQRDGRHRVGQPETKQHGSR